MTATSGYSHEKLLQKCQRQAEELRTHHALVVKLRSLIRKLEYRMDEKQKTIEAFERSRFKILELMWQRGGEGPLVEAMTIIDVEQDCLQEKLRKNRKGKDRNETPLR